jgi:hypothetical protein
MGSPVLLYSHFTLIVLLYWLSLSSTLLGVDPLQALSFWSHLIFYHANDCFTLEVPTPMEGVSLSIGTWDSSSPPRVSDEVVRLRVKWWTQHNQALWHALSPTPERKSCMGDCEDPLLDYPDIIWSPRLMHPSSFSCAPPPFINLRTRFLLRGEGCNITYFGKPNQSH